MKPGEWRQELGSPGWSPGAGWQIRDLKRSRMEQEEEGSREARKAEQHETGLWSRGGRNLVSRIDGGAREQKQARVR